MKFEKWFCRGCGVWVTKEPWPHLDRRLLPMALQQQEALEEVRAFLDQNSDMVDQPDYARGLIQGIVEVFEEAGVNMTPILQDALSELLQAGE